MPRVQGVALPKKRVRDADASRAAVFAAAAEEFATRGFDGAKVDRIAARAGVNKAMLYYHYTDKAALYREVVGDMFAATAAALAAMRAQGGTPEAQLMGFVDVIAREGQARPHFPGMWLRELADGGVRLDDRNFADLFAIVSTLGAIVQDGASAKQLRPMPAFLVQMGIVGPLFLFLATGPMRKLLRTHLPVPPPEIPTNVFIDYVKTMTLGALRVDDAPARAVARTRTKAPAKKRTQSTQKRAKKR